MALMDYLFEDVSSRNNIEMELFLPLAYSECVYYVLGYEFV